MMQPFEFIGIFLDRQFSLYQINILLKAIFICIIFFLYLIACHPFSPLVNYFKLLVGFFKPSIHFKKLQFHLGWQFHINLMRRLKFLMLFKIKIRLTRCVDPTNWNLQVKTDCQSVLGWWRYQQKWFPALRLINTALWLGVDVTADVTTACCLFIELGWCLLGQADLLWIRSDMLNRSFDPNLGPNSNPARIRPKTLGLDLCGIGPRGRGGRTSFDFYLL